MKFSTVRIIGSTPTIKVLIERPMHIAPVIVLEVTLSGERMYQDRQGKRLNANQYDRTFGRPRISKN